MELTSLLPSVMIVEKKKKKKTMLVDLSKQEARKIFINNLFFSQSE